MHVPTPLDNALRDMRRNVGLAQPTMSRICEWISTFFDDVSGNCESIVVKSNGPRDETVSYLGLVGDVHQAIHSTACIRCSMYSTNEREIRGASRSRWRQKEALTQLAQKRNIAIHDVTNQPPAETQKQSSRNLSDESEDSVLHMETPS
jgi:hypothetical protein